jgi:hypothetical protein
VRSLKTAAVQWLQKRIALVDQQPRRRKSTLRFYVPSRPKSTESFSRHVIGVSAVALL